MNKFLIATAAVALTTTTAIAQAQTDAPATDPAAVPTEETTTAPGLEPSGVVDPATGTTTDPAVAPTDPATVPADPAAPGTDPAMTTTTDPATTTTTTTTDPALTTTTGMDHTATGLDHTRTVTIDQPGVTASWLTSRSILTTNQPSTTEWVDVTTTERPAEWEQIADVSDLVLTDDGQLVGYTADIGGFLGLGGRTVMLDNNALHVVRFGDDAYLVTNYSREELENLPEFDTNMVHD